MDRLAHLYHEFGQSPWLDNLKRGYITSGQLHRLVDKGIRGLTSNPTIFQYPAEDAVAMAAQQQVAAYFESDGSTNPDPNSFLKGVFAGTTLFGMPSVKRLPCTQTRSPSCTSAYRIRNS